MTEKDKECKEHQTHCTLHKIDRKNKEKMNKTVWVRLKKLEMNSNGKSSESNNLTIVPREGRHCIGRLTKI